MTDWSSTELSAVVRARLAADLPIILGNNRLRGLAAASMQWRTSGSFASGSDGTSAAAPSTWLSDGYTHKACSAGSAAAEWSLIINLGALVTFDAVAIIGHNFGSVGGLTATLGVATLNTFASEQVIATWTPGTSNKRLVNVAMDHTGASHARQYTAQYVRLRLTKGSTFVPQIGELFLSTRRQLSDYPDRPYDERLRRTHATEFVSGSRITTRYIEAEGQRILNAKLSLWDSASRDDIEAFWTTDSARGKHPFVWIPRPATAPQDAPLMLAPLQFSAPWEEVIGLDQRFDLVASEQGTQFAAVEV